MGFKPCEAHSTIGSREDRNQPVLIVLGDGDNTHVFRDIEKAFDEPIELQCIGGFAIVMQNHGGFVAQAARKMPEASVPKVSESFGQGLSR